MPETVALGSDDEEYVQRVVWTNQQSLRQGLLEGRPKQ